MNMAHVHLLLNHIPIIAIPVAILFLGHSFWARNFRARKFAYVVLVFAATSVLPVYLTGEPAEEVVEHLQGVSETFIEPHEDAAKVAMILTLVTGLAAFVALLAGQQEKKEKLARNAVFVMAILALISLAYTANLGGKIRHTELREANP